MRPYHILPLLSLLPLPLLGQSDLANPAWEQPSAIRFFLSAPRQNFTVREPLRVKATLRNESTELQVLTVPSDPVFAFDFLIYDKFREPKAKRPAAGDLTERDLREDLRGVREIRLLPGEEWSVTFDLNDRYVFTVDGRHLVQGWFVDPRTRRKIWSNPLLLTLRPDATIRTQNAIAERILREERERTLTPEGTVEFFLESIVAKDWESAFKHLNWDRIIPLYADFAPRWNAAASEAERRRVIADFQAWFKASEYRELQRFRIQNIFFPKDPDERVVYAYVGFSPRIRPQNYLNTYRLRRRGNKWYIDHIESLVTKTREWEDFDANRNLPAGRTP